MTLIEPDKFEYQGKGVAVPLVPGLPAAFGVPTTIVFEDGRRLESVIMLDLGYGDALQLLVGGPNKITVPDNAIPARLGRSMQGTLYGHVSRVKSLEIGGYTLDGVMTDFVAEEYTDIALGEPMLGMEVFRRFNIVFDYPGHRMFFEPNKSFTEPFEYNMTGMETSRKGDDLVIEYVHPKSPAAEADLKIGDLVSAINGQPIRSYDFWERLAIFKQEGKTVTLGIRDGESERDVKLVLKRVI